MPTTWPTTAPHAATAAEATRSIRRLRRGRAGRRLLTAALVVLVLAGLTFMLGERVGHVTAAGNGYVLTVDYPDRTRGGLTQDIDISLRRHGGFEGPVTLAVSVDYLAMFEEQGLQPAPTSATATGDRLLWSFDPPPGDTLRVLFDARVEPHRFGRASGGLAVLEGGNDAVSVELETFVMP